MPGKPTGVQTNQGHASTDDYITRTYVLPLLTDEGTRSRLIAEHKANPVAGPPKEGRPPIEHSKDLRTVLDKFRRQPMQGKYITVCKRLHQDYRIGICSGVRGEPVDILEDSFSSEEESEHAIFLKRIADLLEQYSL
jgi:branched-chain amino acid transport system permease protein